MTSTIIEHNTTEIIDYLKKHNRNGMLNYLIGLLGFYEDGLISLENVEADDAYIDFMNHHGEDVKKELTEILIKTSNETKKTNGVEEDNIMKKILLKNGGLMKLSLKKAKYLVDHISSNPEINSDNTIRNIISMLKLYIDNDGTVSESDLYDNNDYISLQDNKNIQQILVEYDVKFRESQESQKNREIQQLLEECKKIEKLCTIRQKDIIVPIKRAETHHKNHSSYPTGFSEFKDILNDILGDEIYEEEVKKDIYEELDRHINPESQDTYEYACNLGIDKHGNTWLIIFFSQSDTIDHTIVKIADTFEGTHHVLDHIGAYYNNIKNALDYSDIDK